MKLTFLATALITASALTPAAIAQDNRNITVGLQVEPNYLDGCSISSRQVGIVLRENVVQTLTVLDAETSEPRPLLATSWEQIDPNTWRFHLREGVKFSDGADFNAQAVATALERHQDPAIACLDRTKISGMTITTSIIDDHTVDIITDPPQVLLPVLLNFLGMTSPNADAAQLERDAVGTGPYVLRQWAGDGTIVISQNADYWGDLPEVQQATYVVRPDSTVRAAMVELGEVDIGLDIAHQDATNTELDFSYLNTETTRVRIVLIEPPLDDIRVRRALNLAFDRDAMIGTIMPEGVQKATQFILPNINGYNPNLEVWPFDPEEAKRLLDEARADGVPVDKPLRLIGRIGFFNNQQEMLEVTAQMWNAVGMNITVEMMEQSLWLDLVNRPYPPDRTAMLIQEQHDNANGDASFTLPFKYRTGGTQSDISFPELDAMMDEAAISTGERRTELYQEVNRIVAEEIIPAVPQFHMVSFMRIAPHIDYVPDYTANGRLDLSKVGFK